MFFVSTFRVIKFAFQNFIRNFWLSLVTVAIIVLALFSFTTLFAVNALTNVAISSVEKKVDLSLYFYPELTEERILLIGRDIAKWDGVSSVDYVSPVEALENFKIAHRNDPLILESLDELADNPLGSALIIKSKDISQYKIILEKIKNSELMKLLERKDFKDNEMIVRKLKQVSDSVNQIGFIVSAVFVLIAVLVVFNTIRIGIYTRRDEIGIMRLVGASNVFIRMPFVVEGILYALVSSIIFWIIFFLIIRSVSQYSDSIFSGIDFDLLQYFRGVFWELSLKEFAGILVLNLISITFALSRYLNI